MKYNSCIIKVYLKLKLVGPVQPSTITHIGMPESQLLSIRWWQHTRLPDQLPAWQVAMNHYEWFDKLSMITLQVAGCNVLSALQFARRAEIRTHGLEWESSDHSTSKLTWMCTCLRPRSQPWLADESIFGPKILRQSVLSTYFTWERFGGVTWERLGTCLTS